MFELTSQLVRKPLWRKGFRKANEIKGLVTGQPVHSNGYTPSTPTSMADWSALLSDVCRSSHQFALPTHQSGDQNGERDTANVGAQPNHPLQEPTTVPR